MASKVVIPFLVGMMILTGSANTLLSKYQDNQCVRNCNSADPKHRRLFSQPVIQTAQMFFGEAGCWLVVGGCAIYRRYVAKDAPLFKGGYEPVNAAGDGPESDEEGEEPGPAARSLVPNADDRRPLVGWKVLLLALPACCDLTGTTLMNVGLLFVAASIYQMTRGALVLFVGLFSVIFLHRKLYLYHWTALFIVVLGVAIVGLAGAIAPSSQGAPTLSSFAQIGLRALQATSDDARVMVSTPDALQTILGVSMIAGAQIFTATQFVLEEWILEHYALESLKVVGWEGFWGFVATFIGMIILHLAIGRTPAGRYGYFDAVEGWRQITEYRIIAVTSILIMISIGGFNYFGLSVTRSVSATARSTIDTSRTLFIWLVSLGLGWETFKWLQIVGFALLVYGTFMFNDIVQPPLRACIRRERHEALLPEAPIEHL